MITQEIELHRPATRQEVLDLLARYGDEAKLLGGGMSLVPAMNLGLARPAILISLNHVDELAYIQDRGEAVAIGGRTRHAAVVASPLLASACPLLVEAARHIGDVQVRNRGTVGGSVTHADPAADYLPVLAAVEATFVLESAAGQRRLTADAFFVDILTTDVRPDELVREVLVPRLPPSTGSAYLRLARVEGSFAIVNVACLYGPGRVRIAVGGVAGTPVIVDATATITGELDEQALDAAAELVRDACRDAFEDLNGDREYRREMSVVLARRALRAAADRRGS